MSNPKIIKEKHTLAKKLLAGGRSISRLAEVVKWAD
jgi:hypothetical protein